MVDKVVDIAQFSPIIVKSHFSAILLRRGLRGIEMSNHIAFNGQGIASENRRIVVRFAFVQQTAQAALKIDIDKP